MIEARFADTDVSRLPTLAKELVDLGVDVILTIGTAATRAAKKATTTIPIVMAGAGDPIGNGFIASLAHPGGNVTGLTRIPIGSNFFGKGVQFFKEVAPNVSRIAVLGIIGSLYPGVREAAEELNVVLLEHDMSGVKNASDFNDVLVKIISERAEGVFVTGEFVNVKYMYMVLDFLTKNHLPSMFEETVWVDGANSLGRAEGLLSYFTDVLELRRRSAFFVDKLFKGAKPSELPVEQPTRFKLAINLKTAKALGLTVPQSVLQSADEVIE